MSLARFRSRSAARNSNNFTLGYLADAEPPNTHHFGWPVVNDDSYWNSATFGVVYEPTSGECGGVGCDAFSISVSGVY